MDKEHFYKLLENPEAMGESDGKALQALSIEHPYFALSKVLVSKYYHNSKPTESESFVLEASCYVLNRKAFKDYLTPFERLITTKTQETKPNTALESQKNEETEITAQTKPIEIKQKDSTLISSPSEETEHPKENHEIEEERLVESRIIQSKPEETRKTTKASPSYTYKKPSLPPNIETGLNIFKTKPKERKAKSGAPQQQKLISIKNYWSPPKKEELGNRGAKKYTQRSVIDHFLKNNPSIQRSDRRVLSKDDRDLSQPSAQLTTAPTSEPFAELLLRQGKFLEAKAVYKELQLRNPEKSAYFASKIAETERSAQ